MTPEEKDAAVNRLVAANVMFRDLRDSLNDAAALAKEHGASALAFAAYHLSESLGSYATELTKFVCGELQDE